MQQSQKQELRKISYYYLFQLRAGCEGNSKFRDMLFSCLFKTIGAIRPWLWQRLVLFMARWRGHEPAGFRWLYVHFHSHQNFLYQFLVEFQKDTDSRMTNYSKMRNKHIVKDAPHNRSALTYMWIQVVNGECVYLSLFVVVSDRTCWLFRFNRYDRIWIL